ncbi:MAG: helicase-related protein [Bacteroidota bacterium]|nr:helicase-related protein [Bacteroidota bacterium]
MAKYQVGNKVTNVNSHEKGVIIDVLAGGRGRQLYRVRYGNEDKDSLETNLIHDTDLTDPFECCKQGLFGSYLDFSRINTTFKIHNTSNNTISSLKASKTIFKAYQFKPLLKFLNSANRRLLIADEVGLGKTIEAGHIMMELAARKELRNVLVVCPKMLQEKWKTELKEKFNFSFKIYDRKKDLVNDLSSGTVKGIVNYESIRSSEKNKEETNPLLALIAEHIIKFDMILCDEAHRMRNSGTKTYKGAEILMPFSTSAVFLTATPIMISEENLFNLLCLLDNQQFNNKEIFQTYLSINKPFITAISRLNNNVNLLEIAENLKKSGLYIHYGEENTYEKNTTVDQLFSGIPLYKKIIEDLTTKPDTIDNRVQLQFDISSMSMMNNIFSRTRKREVTTDWTQPVREPQTKKVELYEDEREQFETVISEYIEDHGYIDEYGDAKLSQGHALGLIQRKRRIASSVYAYLNEEDYLNKGLDEYASYRDAKFDELIEIIKEIVTNNKKKLIVFALFKNTLKYLAIRLLKSGYTPVVIHGDIAERDEVIRKFKTNNSVNILLSSEVGSEGLDLQFCDALVNYDLPWNPMVVEQRIGRIDRFGQNSQIVNIYNLIVKNSIQEEIFDRLLNRIGIFRSCIGDLEAIFDKDTESGTLQQRIVKLEKELYCTELTEEERTQKIENISKAILIEKQNLEQINEGLTDTLTNDTYFRNEIEKIQKNYRYITEEELYNYIQSLIRNHLTECTLKHIREGVYKFCIPLSNKTYLTNFLNRYQSFSNDVETELLFRQFINSIRDNSEFELTFNQDTAYNNQGLIFVNAYHPLIIATKECFKQNFKESNTAFQFGINKGQFNDLPQITCGEYFLAIYTIYLTRKWFGKVQNNELLIPIVFDIKSDSIINDKDVSEQFFGVSQLYATVNQIPYQPTNDLIDEVRIDMAMKIDSIFNDYLEDQKMRLDTSKALQIQRTEEFYNNRIKILEQTLSDLEFKVQHSFSEEERARIQRVLPAQRGLLKNMIAEKQEAIQKINDSEIQTKVPKLISLSQIKVY